MLPLQDAESVVTLVASQPNVRAVSRRINTGGLISNRDASQAVNITAIEPQVEAPVSLVAENIVAGRFLEPEDRDSIVIGRALADHLEATVGDRVSLLGRQQGDTMRQRSMDIVGIFDLGLGDAEKSFVFMNLATAQTLYNLRDQETEVAVILDDIGQEQELIDTIAPMLPGYEVDSINTLRPEFGEAMATDRAMGLLMGGILLLMGGIGILNIMLMAVFERTREMGVLAALGMKGQQVMSLFVMEGAFIGLVGSVIGCILAWLLVAWVNRSGIDFSSIVSDLDNAGELYAMMGTVLYPAISASTIINYGIAGVIVAALAALIPAWQAARKEPAESLHFI